MIALCEQCSGVPDSGPDIACWVKLEWFVDTEQPEPHQWAEFAPGDPVYVVTCCSECSNVLVEGEQPWYSFDEAAAHFTVIESRLTEDQQLEFLQRVAVVLFRGDLLDLKRVWEERLMERTPTNGGSAGGFPEGK